MTELVKVADINKAHKNPIAELVQIVRSLTVILRLRAKEKH